LATTMPTPFNNFQTRTCTYVFFLKYIFINYNHFYYLSLDRPLARKDKKSSHPRTIHPHWRTKYPIPSHHCLSLRQNSIGRHFQVIPSLWTPPLGAGSLEHIRHMPQSAQPPGIAPKLIHPRDHFLILPDPLESVHVCIALFLARKKNHEHHHHFRVVLITVPCPWIRAITF